MQPPHTPPPPLAQLVPKPARSRGPGPHTDSEAAGGMSWAQGRLGLWGACRAAHEHLARLSSGHAGGRPGPSKVGRAAWHSGGAGTVTGSVPGAEGATWVVSTGKGCPEEAGRRASPVRDAPTARSSVTGDGLAALSPGRGLALPHSCLQPQPEGFPQKPEPSARSTPPASPLPEPGTRHTAQGPPSTQGPRPHLPHLPTPPCEVLGLRGGTRTPHPGTPPTRALPLPSTRGHGAPPPGRVLWSGSRGPAPVVRFPWERHPVPRQRLARSEQRPAPE